MLTALCVASPEYKKITQPHRHFIDARAHEEVMRVQKDIEQNLVRNKQKTQR